MAFRLFGRSSNRTKNDPSAFRFSEALTETGEGYKADFNHYQPLQLTGDPEVKEYLPIKLASIVDYW